MTDKKNPSQSSFEEKGSTKPKKKFNDLLDSQENEMSEYLDRISPINQVDTQPTQRISTNQNSSILSSSESQDSTKPICKPIDLIEKEESINYSEIQINEATHHMPNTVEADISNDENNHFEKELEDSNSIDNVKNKISTSTKPILDEKSEDIPAPPPLGDIKFSRPAIDQNGMPLNEKEGETSQIENKYSRKKTKKKKS